MVSYIRIRLMFVYVKILMAEEEAFEEVPMSNALSKKLRNKLQSINEEDVSSPIEAKEMFRRRVNRVLMAFDVNKRLGSLMLLIALLTEWPTEDAPWTFDTLVEKVQAYMTVVFKCRVDAFGRLNQDFDRYVNSYVQFLQRASDCGFRYRRTGLTHFSLNSRPNNLVNLRRLDEELRAAREELKNLELELRTLRAAAAE
ncbi:hypothetical protein DM860_016478 [Cuscuta australis]|uniref:Uncharacterized protein n=1 Tax=Cuscuta australis TaxID=267555 RepID=A0A328E367_9ASTE|nr:hypothetical protein DM860_016478 [Cuscuta australis]